MAPFLQLSDLAWSTPAGQPLLAKLNLRCGPSKIGLVGRNGVGKTTLLKLIAGDLTPTRGRVAVSGSLGVLRQMVQVDPAETIADLFGVTESLQLLDRIEAGVATEQELAVADWTLETRLTAALDRVGLQAGSQTRLATLSGGQRTRVSLAAMLFHEPDFLLLDEPTNNLDRDGRRAVIDMLADWRAGAIVVSHDRELLETMESIVELTSLGAKEYGGNWSTYREQKHLELAAAERNLADAEKRLSTVDRGHQAAREKQARRSSAGKREAARGGIPKILLGGRKENAENTSAGNERLNDRLREQAEQQAATARSQIEILQPFVVELPTTNLPTSKVVLRLDALTAGYDPARPIIQNLTFELIGPERVAITGPNGSGKTTLLAAITGQLQPLSGVVQLRTDFALLDQQVSLLDPTKSIRDNFRRLNHAADENACRASLARFMFRADAALQIAGTLSGGQLLRAGLACVLGKEIPPPLLIFDEPTNHLDIDSIKIVEAGLRAYDGALLVVSHDESFLQAIGITRRLEL